MSIAVLDLGTNTFNLLIAEKKEVSPFSILHSSILPVKIGKGGISENRITQEAMDRVFAALDQHAQSIQAYSTDTVYAFATSAIRGATNGKDFAKEIKKRYGWELRIIAGDKEAELIYYGVRASREKNMSCSLILDIGGGSNEFIIGNFNEIFWKQSFPLGIARLIAAFPPSDPVTEKELGALEKYFDSQLASLFQACQKYAPLQFIGASGTFDTIVSLLRVIMPEKYPVDKKFSRSVDMMDFETIHKAIITSTNAQRQTMQGLDPARIEMIVYASFFVHYIFSKIKMNDFFQSDFSLKEGAAWCVFNGKSID